MRVRVGDETYRGRTVDLSDAPVDGESVAAAVRGDRTGAVSVACIQPAPVHRRAGHVRPGMSLRVRTAVAAAARSRGLTAPQDDKRRTVCERLAAIDPPADPDVAAARRRRANTDGEVQRLRERVATLRGRLRAAREAGRDAKDVEAELNDAVRALSEAETERAAAREAVDRARREAREARDRRERRRRLEERLGNLARDARAHLVDALHGEFAAALETLPWDTTQDEPFDADPVPAALAVCRVARLHAPVVLEAECDRFSDPGSAANWLDAPVVRV